MALTLLCHVKCGEIEGYKTGSNLDSRDTVFLSHGSEKKGSFYYAVEQLATYCQPLSNVIISVGAREEVCRGENALPL